jgi:uncharacterized cofD-like protein
MKVTGLGGGHGLAATLQASLLYADEVSAVVTVADDGGSSGRLTRDLGIPPPGDIRNCLVALADEGPLTHAYQHRFREGALAGHTLGNLLIAALTEMSGDFTAAVGRAGELVAARGRVFPATTEVVSLRAQVDGQMVKGQVAVARAASPIQAVFLHPPDPVAEPRAVEAICEADQVVLGPGSLFTSLIATVMVPGIRRALTATTARRVFVCNSRTQAGETTGLSASAHLESLLAHAGPHAVDTVVVQSPEIARDGVVLDRGALRFSGVEVVEADLVGPSGGHDPELLAKVLAGLV